MSITSDSREEKFYKSLFASKPHWTFFQPNLLLVSVKFLFVKDSYNELVLELETWIF